MIRRTLPIAALSLLTAVGLAAPAAAAPPDHRGHDRGNQGKHDRGNQGKGAQVHQVDLDALNNSGVEGKAVLILRGDQLRVHITARGLTPGMVHPQHIHGLSGDTNAVCPPESAQDNIAGLPEEAEEPDEFIALEEGLPFYGPILQPLTPFPTANPAGVVTYTRSFTVDGDLTDLSDEAIVLHGRFLDGTYVATLPVACGEID